MVSEEAKGRSDKCTARPHKYIKLFQQMNYLFIDETK